MFAIKRTLSVLLVALLVMGTVTCADGVGLKVSAAALTYTDPLEGTITSIGQHGKVRNHQELDKEYTDGWLYTYGEVYEVPADIEPTSANLKTWLIEENKTDGYVLPGQYVFVAMGFSASKNYCVGAPTYAIAHTPGIINNIYDCKTQNKNKAVTLSDNATDNTDLEKYGSVINFDNSYVKNNGFRATIQTTAGTAETNAFTTTNTRYTEEQLSEFCASRQVCKFGDAYAHTVSDNADGTIPWSSGILYQISPDAKIGDVGSIWLPYATGENVSSNAPTGLWKIPGMTVTGAAQKVGMLQFKENETAPKKSNLFPGAVILDDFGATFCVGYSPDPEESGRYTATFVDEDNTTVLETRRNVSLIKATRLPIPPKHTGKTFAGWVDINGDKMDFPFALEYNTSFYASYKTNTYTLTYDLGYGDKKIQVDKLYGDKIDDVKVPEREGYSFKGWSWATPDGEKPLTMPAGNTTATAIWELNKWSLVYRVDGEQVMVFSDIPYGTEITEEYQMEAPVSQVAEFSGWIQLPEIMPDHDVIVMGTFGEVCHVDYSYTDLDGVYKEYCTMYYPLGEVFQHNVSAPKIYNDYYFEWDYSSVGDTIDDIGIGIYGEFFPIERHFTWKDEKTGYEETAVCYAGDNIPALAKTPTCNGYTFDGWEYVLEDEDNAVIDMPLLMPSCDVTATAKWIPHKNNVTYLDTTGCVFQEFKGVEFGTKIPVPTKHMQLWGYEVTSWKSDYYGDTMPDFSLTFKPIISPGTYDAVFDLAGGMIDSNLDYVIKPTVFNKEIETPKNPTRPGYTFVKWEPEVGMMDQDGKAFTAIWEKNTYTINVYKNSSMSETITSFSLSYNDNIPVLTQEQFPSENGKTFLHWTDDEGNVLSTDIARPVVCKNGKYTIDKSIKVYPVFVEIPTFSFYIPANADDTGSGEQWVLVNTYEDADWTQIKKDVITKIDELGLSYYTDDTSIMQGRAPKWYTNSEGTEGGLLFNGKVKYADKEPVSIDMASEVHTSYYLCGKQRASVELKLPIIGEDGQPEIDETTGQIKTTSIYQTGLEGNTTVFKVSDINAHAPKGKKMSKIVYENGDVVSYSADSVYIGFTYKAGENIIIPVYEDIEFVVIFYVDGSAIADTTSLVYGNTLTVDSAAIRMKSGYTGISFPAVVNNIPDFSEHPEMSTEYYDKDLGECGKPGLLLAGWKDHTGNFELDSSTSIKIDDKFMNAAYEVVDTLYDGKLVIKLNAVTVPLFYQASFDCGDNGRFADGNSKETLWVAVNTGFETMSQKLREQYGEPTPNKDEYSFWGWKNTTSMPANDTTFYADISSNSAKIYYVYENLHGEALDYGKLTSLNPEERYSCATVPMYCGDSGEHLDSTDPEFAKFSILPGQWDAQSVFLGWELQPAAEYEDENGNVIKFAGNLDENGNIAGNMVYVAKYKDFSDYRIIVYNSKTSDLLGLKLEQIVSGDMQRAYNASIYKTVEKGSMKTTYWKDGKQVSKKEAELNPQSETGENGTIVIGYQIKLINFNFGQLFSPNMWKSVYIAARPIVIHKSTFDPRQTFVTISTLFKVIGGLFDS